MKRGNRRRLPSTTSSPINSGQQGLALISIAPKFIGDFEKGVDYKGDIGELERSLADHAALARELGPYKLSLHSGSDKLSLYPILARTTNGCFHVKTAGTSYLEALRVVARHDESLFRRVIEVSRQHYDRDKATYHVSADIRKLPFPEDVRDVVELEKIYLERWSDVPSWKRLHRAGPASLALHVRHDSDGPRTESVDPPAIADAQRHLHRSSCRSFRATSAGSQLGGLTTHRCVIGAPNFTWLHVRLDSYSRPCLLDAGFC